MKTICLATLMFFLSIISGNISIAGDKSISNEERANLVEAVKNTAITKSINTWKNNGCDIVPTIKKLSVDKVGKTHPAGITLYGVKGKISMVYLFKNDCIVKSNNKTVKASQEFSVDYNYESSFRENAFGELVSNYMNYKQP